MRVLSNGIKVFKLDELSNEARFKLYEDFYGKEIVFMSENDVAEVSGYYSGVEFFEDGTVYEEVQNNQDKIKIICYNIIVRCRNEKQTQKNT